MYTAAESWPLPGQLDPSPTPCAFCRRRLRINGKPVFQTCSCQAFGPSVTVGALALGAALALAGAWWAGHQSAHRN